MKQEPLTRKMKHQGYKEQCACLEISDNPTMED